MKLSAAWLSEWVKPGITQSELLTQLTMGGIEITASPGAERFSKVVIGTILTVSRHPQADKLQICTVSIGAQNKNLNIVCGASNVAVGMKVAVAVPGAHLPPGKFITVSVIRGCESHGMLCSANELGLWEGSGAQKSAAISGGILALPEDAPEGEDLWHYLQLDDDIFEVALTPNRGDCLSVYGLAREIALITNSELRALNFSPVQPTITDIVPVNIVAVQECTQYRGRIIRNFNPYCLTPLWLQEKLRRSGMKSINLIVDITNYVMLELGQPLHAFDLAKIRGGITVRMAKPHESLHLLDSSNLVLDDESLLIADHSGPLALAGVMGGMESSIQAHTPAIFLESACFRADIIARQRQKYQLSTEAAYRFERGVDPNLATIALERATSLLISIAGGDAGDVVGVAQQPDVCCTNAGVIRLRRDYLNKILGNIKLSDDNIINVLQRLGCKVNFSNAIYLVTAPSWRCDLQQEIDLVEEIARIYGYDNIPAALPKVPLAIPAANLAQTAVVMLQNVVCNLGYNEVITYSFIAHQMQELFDPGQSYQILANPISSNMNTMRTTLWPGLLNVYLYNRDRQQLGGRFFEVGLCFTQVDAHLHQNQHLSGLISGYACPEQWGVTQRLVDFYDLKGDIEYILVQMGLSLALITFVSCNHPALHPGQASAIYYGDTVLGLFGALHPKLVEHFAVTEPVFLFTLHVAELLSKKHYPSYKAIVKFPSIRRDLALIVDEQVVVAAIDAAIWQHGGEILRQVQLFDIYRGDGITTGKKSLAFRLIFQHQLRTLQEHEIVETMNNIIAGLRKTWIFEIRGAEGL